MGRATMSKRRTRASRFQRQRLSTPAANLARNVVLTTYADRNGHLPPAAEGDLRNALWIDLMGPRVRKKLASSRNCTWRFQRAMRCAKWKAPACSTASTGLHLNGDLVAPRVGHEICETEWAHHPAAPSGATGAQQGAQQGPGWRNWQTQRTQNPPTARSWGFDPPSRHQQNQCFAKSTHLRMRFSVPQTGLKYVRCVSK